MFNEKKRRMYNVFKIKFITLKACETRGIGMGTLIVVNYGTKII